MNRQKIQQTIAAVSAGAVIGVTGITQVNGGPELGMRDALHVVDYAGRDRWIDPRILVQITEVQGGTYIGKTLFCVTEPYYQNIIIDIEPEVAVARWLELRGGDVVEFMPAGGW